MPKPAVSAPRRRSTPAAVFRRAMWSWLAAPILAVPVVSSTAPCAHASELMALFTLNDFSTFRTFSPDVDNVPGTPTLTALGDNLSPTPLDGNEFTDFEGTT